VDVFVFWPLYPGKRTQYLLNRRLGGFLNRSGLNSEQNNDSSVFHAVAKSLRSRRRRADNIKMDLGETVLGGVDWMVWLRIGTS
jgi:hypothetical protein